MKARITLMASALGLLSLTGCATSLDSGAEKVQIVTATQKERLCQSLGVVSTEQRIGPNKPSNAMNKAINEVARKGGNGIFIVSSNLDWAEGASVTAEALQCKF
ncbi:hypothetical protein M2401_001647 [Pseudomonas sp. JUb42]|jgi:hypothetical protein|uniref:DUF4156 domain-containing protein n=1 Tax=Pseudomonas sp. JUb42 TaxID=2940611 RepID=UPI0021673581|nr:DUF4156 domain-containing protein [Pseudomonas sp. JUb42]MCS3467922.1 hypothetical protein [Pseudomonas sp. JUb42]